MGDEILPPTRRFITLYQYDTEFSADSVEWCPFKPLHNIFVCACYQIVEEENGTVSRFGRILLCSISPKFGLKLWHTLQTAAVLDQKWCPHMLDDGCQPVLAVVNAKGRLEIYRIGKLKLQLELVDVYELPKTGEGSESKKETLLLSLDWSTMKNHSSEPLIVVGDSKGCVHLFQLLQDKVYLLQTVKTHSFEAWIVGFYYWDPCIYFSGGDDQMLAQYDRRTGWGPIMKNTKTHECGITSFHSNKSKEFLFVTGSYDEYVRLWDIRQLKMPHSQLKMPGPLWRLKWDPFNQDYLLAACMLKGVHVVKLAAQNQLEIYDSYYEHKNITYGVDWSYLNEENVEKYDFDGNVFVASCSFYDHLLCISKTACDF